MENLAKWAIQELANGRDRRDITEELARKGMPIDEADRLMDAVEGGWKETASGEAPAGELTADEMFQRKYPDMRPIASAPSMFTLNGFGFMLYSRRDHDVETGAYVKTYFLTAFDAINRGKASDFPTQEFKNAPKERKQDIVTWYFERKVVEHPLTSAAADKLQEHLHVVPVILQLGIVKLRQAQAAADPAVRQAALEEAERRFLSIKSVASETDEYRLFLGQVYYLLGKSKEGSKLFESYLISQKREPNALVSVAATLREVGETAEAKRLGAEAYESADDPQLQKAIAGFMAVASDDVDESLTWLERTESDSISTRASIAEKRATNALRQGKRAIAQLHPTILALHHFPNGDMPPHPEKFRNSRFSNRWRARAARPSNIQ